MRHVILSLALLMPLAACSADNSADWTYEKPDEIPSGPGLFSDGPQGGITIYKDADEVYQDD